LRFVGSSDDDEICDNAIGWVSTDETFSGSDAAGIEANKVTIGCLTVSGGCNAMVEAEELVVAVTMMVVVVVVAAVAGCGGAESFRLPSCEMGIA